MQIIDDHRCFICGKDNQIGLKAEFALDPEKRRAETRVCIGAEFQGWQGITHGGIISALLDEICAQACMCCGFTVVTSEIKIRYKAPVPTGSMVTVIGEVTGERRRLIDAKGRIELDGKIVAEAEVIMFRTERFVKK
ncbi:MAG: PaaI family thioesterase [Desulfuromonadaceae bacterium]|nr:PaaI family thioesterase [Desulfuromonadaceae bacterium]MDD5106845.1 PaaI family thioesterase [Desulfuromonadaceae bacterium]